MRLDAARMLRSFACGGRTYRYYSVAAAQALGPDSPGDGAGHRNALDFVRGVREHERTGHTRRGVGMVIIARFDARAVEGLREPPIASTPIRGESDNRHLGGV